MNKFIMVEKDNRIPKEQVELICQQIGITHYEFDQLIHDAIPPSSCEVIIDNFIVTYSEDYLDNFDNRYGVTIPAIRETLRHPDKLQRLIADKLDMRYYVKKLEGMDDYLLVEALIMNNDLVVNSVIRLRKDFVEKWSSITPQEQLEKVMDEIGLPVTVGGQEKKFHYSVKVPIVKGGIDIGIKGVNVAAGREGRFRANMLGRVVNENNTIMWHGANVYCIDFSKYEKWLGY